MPQWGLELGYAASPVQQGQPPLPGRLQRAHPKVASEEPHWTSHAGSGSTLDMLRADSPSSKRSRRGNLLHFGTQGWQSTLSATVIKICNSGCSSKAHAQPSEPRQASPLAQAHNPPASVNNRGRQPLRTHCAPLPTHALQCRPSTAFRGTPLSGLSLQHASLGGEPIGGTTWRSSIFGAAPFGGYVVTRFLSRCQPPWPRSRCPDGTATFLVPVSRILRCLRLAIGSSPLARSAYQKGPTGAWRTTRMRPSQQHRCPG